MADALLNLIKEDKKVVAVIGAGHIPGIAKIVKWKLQKKK